MPFLIYRDKMRAEGPNHYRYILGMALNQYKIKPKVFIWIRLHPGLENWQFSVNKNKEGMCCQLQTGWNIYIFIK